MTFSLKPKTLSPDPLLEQNVQPPMDFVPSRLGQVKWAFKGTLAILQLYFDFK